MNDLIYKGVEFPASKKDFSKIEMKKKFVSMLFIKANQLIQFTYQMKKLKIQWIFAYI